MQKAICFSIRSVSGDLREMAKPQKKKIVNNTKGGEKGCLDG